MKECNICLTKINKRNKNEHEQSRKHKYIFFSNLIINKYVIQNDEIDNKYDILQRYHDEHKKKFIRFRIDII